MEKCARQGGVGRSGKSDTLNTKLAIGSLLDMTVECPPNFSPTTLCLLRVFLTCMAWDKP